MAQILDKRSKRMKPGIWQLPHLTYAEAVGFSAAALGDLSDLSDHMTLIIKDSTETSRVAATQYTRALQRNGKPNGPRVADLKIGYMSMSDIFYVNC